MRFFNFSPEPYKRICSWTQFINRKEANCTKVFVFKPREFTEIPDGVFFEDTELIMHGIVEIPFGTSKEEIMRIQIVALNGYKDGNLRVKIHGYEAHMDEMKEAGKTFTKPRDYLRAIKWRDEIKSLTDKHEEENDVVISLSDSFNQFDSFLDTEKTVNLPSIEELEAVNDKVFSEIAETKQQKRRGRPSLKIKAMVEDEDEGVEVLEI